MSFDFNIALTGIGPHSNTKLSSNMNSIQMALYADNGSGKSFKKAELEAIGKVRDMVASTQRELKAKGIQSNTNLKII